MLPMDELAGGLLSQGSHELCHQLGDAMDVDVDQMRVFLTQIEQMDATDATCSTRHELLSMPMPVLQAAETALKPLSPALSTPLPFVCWGAEVKGTSEGCVPDFQSGKGHFKNKCGRVSPNASIAAPKAHIPATVTYTALKNRVRPGSVRIAARASTCPSSGYVP